MVELLLNRPSLSEAWERIETCSVQVVVKPGRKSRTPYGEALEGRQKYVDTDSKRCGSGVWTVGNRNTCNKQLSHKTYVAISADNFCIVVPAMVPS